MNRGTLRKVALALHLGGTAVWLGLALAVAVAAQTLRGDSDAAAVRGGVKVLVALLRASAPAAPLALVGGLSLTWLRGLSATLREPWLMVKVALFFLVAPVLAGHVRDLVQRVQAEAAAQSSLAADQRARLARDTLALPVVLAAAGALGVAQRPRRRSREGEARGAG